MPHPLCCFQGKEMLLFWDNNTNYKQIQQQKCDQIIKVYMHIYTLYCIIRVDVEACDVPL